MDREFNQKDVNHIFGHIPTRTLRWWALMKFYGWAYEIPDGRGLSRIYELENLYQIGVVEELSSLNIPASIIKEIMDEHFKASQMPAPIKLANKDQLKARPPGVKEFEELLKNISKNMENSVLFMEKSSWFFKSKLGERKRLIYSWGAELITPEEIASHTCSHTSSIIINLKDIKERVDTLVKKTH